MEKLKSQSIFSNIEPMLKSIYSKFEKPIIFFDLETSGLDIIKDEILQIYICKYDGQDFTENIELLNINCEIRKEAFEKHKISKDDLKGYPFFKDIANEIYETYFSDKETIICGFNSNKFDVPFIVEKFLENKILKATSIIKNPKIDVYKIYTQMFPNTLEDIYKRFTGNVLENSHSADTDILATVTILDTLIKSDTDFEFISKDEMIDAGGFFKLEEGLVKFTNGKYKDLDILSIDRKEVLGYLNWIKNNTGFSTHTKIITGKLIDKLKSENV